MNVMRICAPMKHSYVGPCSKPAQSLVTRLARILSGARHSHPVRHDLMAREIEMLLEDSNTSIGWLCRYADALQAAIGTNSIRVVLSMVDELAGRGGLAAAIRGRPVAAWLPLLCILSKHVSHPQHARASLSIANLLLDEHAASLRREPDAQRVLQGLRGQLIAEAKVQSDLQAMGGIIDMILNT